MREILFRGKRIDNGEWVYGDLVQSPAHCVVQIYEQDLCGDNFAVDPSTIGQYTGLTDKKYKKIFEGDIIQDKLEDAPELLYIVVFKEGSFLAKCLSIDNEDVYLDDFLLYETFEGIVIGNIHDIPELMEDKP